MLFGGRKVMNASKRRRLRAAAAYTQVICIPESESGLRALADILKKSEIAESCLIYADGYCLGFRAKTKELGGLLPLICEHSERVCLGSVYREIFSEHGSVIIKSGALNILSSH